MKKILFCLLSGAVILLSSCQSDELTENGNSIDDNAVISTLDNRVVQFVMSDAAPAVRSYYSSVSNVNWTNNDEIYVFSTFTDAMDDADHQHAHYNVGETGGYTYGYFNHVVNGSLTDPIYWYDNTQVGEQHFYAYYPAESVGADPEAGRGSIEFDTYEGGSSYFHVPADQSAMAHIIPATSNDEPHPLAYAMAATKKVGVGYEGDESPVEFLFHDIMNVLRIHVNNPTDQPVKGVKVNCSSTYYVAGTATVSTIHERYLGGEGAPLQYGQFYIGFAYNGASSDEVFAIENTPLQTSDLYYDLYLLPNYYSANSLEVTVMMGDDTDASNDITKAIPSVFSQSTMKKVRIDIPEDPVYNYAIYMVDVPGGTFELGGATDSYPAQPVHPTVTLSDFQIGKYEVTQRQWEWVMNDAIAVLQGGANMGHAYRALTDAGFSLSASGSELCKYGHSVGISPYDLWPKDNPHIDAGLGAYHPAYNVDRGDVCNVFIPILNALTNRTYKLPSEAQWEYAARARYSYDYAGATGRHISSVAWYAQSPYNAYPAEPTDGNMRNQSIGLLQANDFGIHDMSGNVAEMCEDNYTDTYPETVPDDYVSTNYGQTFVYRGGDHASASTYVSVTYRASYRYSSWAPDYGIWLGFRLAM